MILYIYPNKISPQFAQKARLAAEHFVALGIKCAAPSDTQDIFAGVAVDFSYSPFDCDYICSVGGDGTMLHAAKHAFHHSKPFFGINAGRVGYLSAFDFAELGKIDEQAILSLIRSPRTLLKINTLKGEYFALNDAVLSKADPARTVQLSVCYGEDAVANWKADGVIVATPTGSTAYAFSAGGPVLTPALEVIELTPICPHSFFNRSIVFDGDKALTFTLAKRAENGIVLSVDGLVTEQFDSGSIKIARALEKLVLLQSEQHDFYSRYKSKNFERDTADEG